LRGGRQQVVRRGSRAQDVSLAIEAGEIVCIAGENGSGKSTLVKILAGVVTPDAGTIEVDGRIRPLWQPIDAVRAGFEVIYQDFSLFPNLTVAENIAFNHQLSERRRLVSWREVRRIAEQGLGKVGVAVPLDALVEQLSVADKQVVAIARALVQGARLIAMDEPTTALTEREVKSLFDIVRRLKADGVAVIFISHKLSEIFAICERVIVLRNGVKVADGPASSLDVVSLSQLMLGRRLDQHARAPTNQAPSFCGSRSSAATGGFRMYLSHCTPERCWASQGFSALAGPLWPRRCSTSLRRIKVGYPSADAPRASPRLWTRSGSASATFPPTG
jgi:simple sugar transport system ATP-binding protein